MSGDHARVHEDVRQTAQKDESARTQGQAHELVFGCEAPDRGGARRRRFERQLDAQVFNENDTPDPRPTSCALTSVWCDWMPQFS